MQTTIDSGQSAARPGGPGPAETMPMRAATITTPLLVASTAVGLLAGAAPFAATARAQQQIPGISVVLPPVKPSTAEGLPPAPAARPAAASPPAAPQAASPPPKKKPKVAKPAAAPKTAAAKPGDEAATAAVSKPRAPGGQAIIALVNDEPITAYEVEQRQRLMGMGADIREKVQATFKSLIQRPQTSERLKEILNETINANKGKTKEQIIAIFEERKKQYALSLQKQAIESARASVLPGVKKQALDELIDERLKMQEAKRLNVGITDEDADRIVKGIAERNKMTLEQFRAQLASQGTDLNAMRQRFRTQMSWQEVIRRRFGHQVAITERDIDRLVSANPAAPGEDLVELRLTRVTLNIPAKLDQKGVAQRLADADKARRNFKDCKSATAVAASVADAKVEDLGARRPSTIPEPTRSMLLNAKDNEMLPPSVGETGVELWAVCSRTAIKADEKQRTEASEQLKQKEFELLAKRHLKDLRQDAHIEYR